MQPKNVNPNDKRTERLAIGEEQRRLELCLTSAGLGIWTYNIATDEFWANDRAKHLHGHEPHEVHTFAEAGANIHPEDLARAQAAIAEAIQTDSKLQIEYRVVWRDGSIRWLASQAEFVPSGEPGKGMFYGSVQDISERKRIEGDRKRHEANLAFLSEISQDLAHLTNIAATMDAIGAKIGAYFNASLCAFSIIGEGAETMTTAYVWHRAGVPSTIGEHRIRDYHTEDFRQTCRAGKTYVVCDVANDPRANAANIAALQAGAFVSVPIVRDGEWRFNLSIADTVPRDWRKDEIELMQELTARIWTRLERARAEAALATSEEKYRSLFNSIDEGVTTLEIIFDENDKVVDYRFLETNPALTKMTGLTDEIIGKTVSEVVPNLEAFWFETFDRVVKTGEPMRFEYQVEGLSNNWFEVYAARVGGEGSRKVVTVYNNITERKRAQEAMRAFFSNVSHEFRTPLTLLLSSIQETLSDDAHPPSPAQRSQLELAHRNAVRLLKLVNTLLDVSRIEAGRIQAMYEPTDLATLTTELASSFESAIAQAGLQLVIDCPPLPELVYVDRSMWEKIVLNLVSNAFKFTLAGEIVVRLRLVGNQVELTVQDTGMGIAAAERPRLFERFYQVKGAQGRSDEGSGIGLSLVQELVKLHGGTIQVSSVEGESSCFKVSIPTGFAHLPPDRIGLPQTLSSTATEVNAYVKEALQWLPEQSSNVQAPNSEIQAQSVEVQPQSSNIQSSIFNPQTPSSKTARILLVDDNPDMRAYLKRLLDERWQVETAPNGALALTQIQQNPPDLVLTDVMMPEMDGLQLLQALRTNPQTRTIPIILLSARAGEEATIEGLETGADDYLIKPFSARELIARVETHLQLALLRQERSANRLKDEFLATVTHELNAPLAAILTWARLLQTQPFDRPMTLRALETIERNASNQAKLIEDLLDMSSILAGKRGLNPQPVDLVSIIDDVLNNLYPTAQAKAIALTYGIENYRTQNSKITISGEPKRLRQIFANLLSNAIKFTPLGGQIKVQLNTDAEVTHLPPKSTPGALLGETPRPHWLPNSGGLQSSNSPQTWGARGAEFAQISITDTGIGISTDFLPYVFDRFTQAEVPSRHSPGGVGIGLAIARYLVELHGGTIEVASDGEGRGATFTVRLPLIQC